MIAIRRVNGFGFPTWLLPQSISARRAGPTWTSAKEVWVRRAGPTWVKIWHENNWGPVGSQHPHWQFAFNFDFLKIAEPSSDVSWVWLGSDGNSYTYPQSGQLRLNIGSRNANGYGDAWIEPNQPLRVNGGQQYRHAVTIDAKTSNTRVALRAYTAVERADANYKAASVFQTTLAEVTAGTEISHTFTIPSGHNWVKIYLFIETNAALPRNHTFSRWRFRREA